MPIYAAAMIGLLAEVSTTTANAINTWAPAGLIVVVNGLLITWLRGDVNEVKRRLENLEGSHSQTAKDVARMQGTVLTSDAASWQGRESGP